MNPRNDALVNEVPGADTPWREDGAVWHTV